MADDSWADVRSMVNLIFEEQAHVLADLDNSLVWQSSSAVFANGDLSCWLTLSRQGEPDPHMEVTALFSKSQESIRLVADIGTFSGEVFAETERTVRQDGDWADAMDRLLAQLRCFLEEHIELLQRLAFS